jgi:hypothetical protein
MSELAGAGHANMAFGASPTLDHANAVLERVAGADHAIMGLWRFTIVITPPRPLDLPDRDHGDTAFGASGDRDDADTAFAASPTLITPTRSLGLGHHVDMDLWASPVLITATWPLGLSRS